MARAGLEGQLLDLLVDLESDLGIEFGGAPERSQALLHRVAGCLGTGKLPVGDSLRPPLHDIPRFDRRDLRDFRPRDCDEMS